MAYLMRRFKIGFKDRDSINGSDSSVNYPTHSKFELGEDTGLNVLEVAMHRTSIRT